MLAGCTTYTTRVDNAGGRRSIYDDPSSPGAVSGTGIEAQDVIGATDRMMRDILATPAIAGRTTPARVVVDSTYFKNESSSPVNKNLFTDRLRTELNRAASGRIVFVARHQAALVEEERTLEQEGVVTQGTQGTTSPALGYDYRLGGRIASLDAVGAKSQKSRYYQITFELIERGSGVIIWSGAYEFRKTGKDDLLYY
jgi:hypothetical protein